MPNRASASKKPRKFPYTVCTVCGKTMRLRPAGGDWLNALYPFAHDKTPGVRCVGSFQDVKNKDILQDTA